MGKNPIHVRVEEMLEAIDTVKDLIGGLDFDAYASVALRGQRRGVERCIEIVSEASRHLSEDVRARYPNIPWRHVRDIGNVLRHGYSSVDDVIIWRIATKSLPELEIVLRQLHSDLAPHGDC